MFSTVPCVRWRSRITHRIRSKRGFPTAWTWSGRTCAPRDGRLTLVAADEQDQIVAFIDLEPDGHIDRLFCAPEAAGQHIASRLYTELEAAARAQGIGRLHTEASELARRFFERKDFIVLERQDRVLHGVPIHNYRMAKTLS